MACMKPPPGCLLSFTGPSIRKGTLLQGTQHAYTASLFPNATSAAWQLTRVVWLPLVSAMRSADAAQRLHSSCKAQSNHGRRHCTALYCTVIHCTARNCTVLCFTALYCNVPYCNLLDQARVTKTALHWRMLWTCASGVPWPVNAQVKRAHVLAPAVHSVHFPRRTALTAVLCRPTQKKSTCSCLLSRLKVN